MSANSPVASAKAKPIIAYANVTYYRIYSLHNTHNISHMNILNKYLNILGWRLIHLNLMYFKAYH